MLASSNRQSSPALVLTAVVFAPAQGRLVLGAVIFQLAGADAARAGRSARGLAPELLAVDGPVLPVRRETCARARAKWSADVAFRVLRGGSGWFVAYRSYKVWNEYDDQADVKEDEHEAQQGHHVGGEP